MAAVLLDTHALIWLLAGEALDHRALWEIARAQAEGTLYVSVISAWEAGIAAVKPNPAKRPNLQGLSPEEWFRKGLRKIGAKTVPISFRISLEAASVPEILGYGDPGDCFLIATARVLDLLLITRDEKITALSQRRSGFLRLQAC